MNAAVAEPVAGGEALEHCRQVVDAVVPASESGVAVYTMIFSFDLRGEHRLALTVALHKGDVRRKNTHARFLARAILHSVASCTRYLLEGSLM